MMLMSGEGLHQVLETVESGFLPTDDADDNGDVPLRESDSAESGMRKICVTVPLTKVYCIIVLLLLFLN